MLAQKFFKSQIYYFFNKFNVLALTTSRVSKRHPVPCSFYYNIQYCFSFALMSFIYGVKPETVKTANDHAKKTEPNLKETSPASAIAQSDDLFLHGKFKDSYEVLLSLKDRENVEILWRLSRSLYNLSKEKDIVKSKKHSLIAEAYDYIMQAFLLDENHYAVHKWMAILVDAKSSLEGIKSRISTLPIFKQHLITAIKLNPKDATSIYMLGQYAYNVADMSWLQLTLAKTLFGTLPEATFEEAFQYFSKAEEVEPNFYSANLLMLGKTALKLKRTETARYWLKCATSYPVRTDEDEAVRLEAEELLKNCPSQHDSTKDNSEKLQ